MMLEVVDLAVRYGAISAVKGISLKVEAGEIVAMVGANGAGKSTTVKAIAGLLPFSGEIIYDGRRLVPNRAERNVRDGIVLVPEGRGILKQLTVEENLQMGLYARSGGYDAVAEIRAMTDKFPVLGERRSVLAHLLSGGEQQMLAIARALLAKPRLLLLDEPSLGLAPMMSTFVFDLIAELRREGLTVLIVEQRARQALKIADRAYVLETGRMVMEGRAEDLVRDEALSEAFIGGHAHARSAPTSN